MIYDVGMARPCSTCQHIHRAAIDRRLASGEPTKRVARDYGLSPVSLGRHKTNCAGIAAGPAITKTASQASVALASLPTRNELGQAYGDLRSRIDGIVSAAEQAGSLAVAIQGLNALRQSLDSVARIAGHDRPVTSEVTIDMSVNIHTAVDALVAAIGPAPSNHQIIELEKIADGA